MKFAQELVRDAGRGLPTDAPPILGDGGDCLTHNFLVGSLPVLPRPGFSGGDGHAFKVVDLNLTTRDEAIRRGFGRDGQVARLVGLVPQARRELHLRPAGLGALLGPRSWCRASLSAVLSGCLVTGRRQTETQHCDASSTPPARRPCSPSSSQHRPLPNRRSELGFLPHHETQFGMLVNAALSIFSQVEVALSCAWLDHDRNTGFSGRVSSSNARVIDQTRGSCTLIEVGRSPINPTVCRANTAIPTTMPTSQMTTNQKPTGLSSR
jgi:hypothetical protein